MAVVVTIVVVMVVAQLEVAMKEWSGAEGCAHSIFKAIGKAPTRS